MSGMSEQVFVAEVKHLSGWGMSIERMAGLLGMSPLTLRNRAAQCGLDVGNGEEDRQRHTIRNVLQTGRPFTAEDLPISVDGHMAKGELAKLCNAGVAVKVGIRNTGYGSARPIYQAAWAVEVES